MFSKLVKEYFVIAGIVEAYISEKLSSANKYFTYLKKSCISVYTISVYECMGV